MGTAERREIHIATSCDNRLTRYIPTQLVSIAENLKAYDVHFWLFHFRIPSESVEKLRSYSKSLGIEFHEVIINDTKPYDYLVSISADNNPFPLEVFFPLCMHQYTPDSVDRILYIDAGDVIVCDDIGDFYFTDFEGNCMVVETGFSSCRGTELYTAYDLYDRSKYIEITSEYFNAGIMLFNLDMLRNLKIDMDFYIGIAHRLRDMHNKFFCQGISSDCHFFSEQGLLAVAFLGFIKFFRLFNNNTLTQYNFRPFVCEFNKEYRPEVVNFTLADCGAKLIHYLGNKPWSTDSQKYKSLLRISREALDLYDEYDNKVKESGIEL